MPYTRLEIERDGAIARVFLNRPKVRNAFDDGLITELHEAFGELGKDDSVRVIVLGGRGKVFCAGADVNWMRASMDLPAEKNREDALRMANMLQALDECPKPVIGRIHGAAMGGGSGLVATCDIVVASEETKFAFSEVKLGILPATISVVVLPKIGFSNARRYFLTAEVFKANVAWEMGLIHEVATSQNLDARVNEICTSIINNGPNAVAEAKKLIHAVRLMQRDEWIPHSVDTISRVRTSPEGQEGLKAFLEKRPPSWLKS